MTNKERVTLTLEAYANVAFESEDAIVDALCSSGVERLESERLVALVPLAFGRDLISHMGEFDFPKSAILTARDGSLKLCDLAADALYRCAVEEAASMFHQGPRHLFQPAASASAEVQVLNQFLDSKADADLAGIRFIEPQFLRVTYEEWTRSGGVGTKRVTVPFKVHSTDCGRSPGCSRFAPIRPWPVGVLVYRAKARPAANCLLPLRFGGHARPWWLELR